MWDVISLHHTNLPQYMKEMKKYHLAHHYKNFELGYGVTSEDFLRHLHTKSPKLIHSFFFQVKFGIMYLTQSFRYDLDIKLLN